MSFSPDSVLTQTDLISSRNSLEVVITDKVGTGGSFGLQIFLEHDLNNENRRKENLKTLLREYGNLFMALV